MVGADVLDMLVPITSFNKGHASRLFERAKRLGTLFVLKNNVPEAVILSPEEYARMSEAEENYVLLLMAAERLSAGSGEATASMEDVMAELGITEGDLDSLDDVELA